MTETINLSGGQRRLTIDSDKESAVSLNVECAAGSDSELVIELIGRQPLDIRLQGRLEADSRLVMLSINHCKGPLILKERHVLLSHAQANFAYAQFSDADLTIGNDYVLAEAGARLQATSASLTASRKQLNFSCEHQAGQTEAHIDNYGVVLAHGHCEMIVKNTIAKGCHKAQTHQASRILTYDKTAYGRILPILYIDDDDVQASHAASLGQPDENQLYYMESRGLSHQQALSLITIGYLMPVTQAIADHDVNEMLRQEIETKVYQQCSI